MKQPLILPAVAKIFMKFFERPRPLDPSKPSKTLGQGRHFIISGMRPIRDSSVGD